METQFQQEPKVPFFQTTTAKMIMVGILTLVLIIPLALVQELIVERSQRQKEVITETTAKWGNSVYFYGPILKVPYKDPMSGANNYAYFFPETLNNKTEVTMVKPLERSIYKSNVFTTKMQFDGNYTTPNFASKGIPAENIYWNRAKILIRTTNLKSLKDEVKMKIGNQNLAFESVANSTNDSIESLETNYFEYQNLQNEAKFNFTISFNGSKQVKMVPIGKTTDAKMTSNWNSPNFNGNFSPISRDITDKGFEANWKILHFNRPFAQSYFDILPELGKYAFAVDFITPVDEYQQSERASKYGFLVIGLTFLIFFLIQSISKINIHIFQYSMIGIALIMFYTLLISITEHSSFSFA
ncbi:MAG: cell envelope integrity protein CreD, partial [Flavobacteriaceae bacterium]